MTHQNAVEMMAAERYLLDEMSELERYNFEEHFFDCDECAEEMRLGSRLRSEAAALFPAASASAGQVVQMSDFARRSRPAWVPSLKVAVPWAAAAMLALALTYQVQGPGPGDATLVEQDAQALTPVSLRPATRGAVPVVALPAESGSVALALDVNMGDPGDFIRYQLTRDDGTVLSNGRAQVPAAGTPFLLMVPADKLRTGGPFVLTIGSDDNIGTPSEYPFTAIAR
jgi:hypothetical protein